MLWSAVGALDANAESVLGMQSLLHATHERALAFVYLSALVSFAVYAFFVSDTIGTFCRVLDINCLSIK